MSKIEVNTIDSQCGSALQIGCTNTATIGLGKSGDTITIPSGATIVNSGTQTGFGRTGTVDWNTTKITADPANAVSGTGYFCDTSGGAFTVTLPTSPSAGDIVALADYTRTFATYNLTIGRNSKPIGGVAQDGKLEVNGQSATFVFVDDTEGWININETQTSQTGTDPYMVATGGTPCAGATCGDYKIHTFTGPGTFCVSNSGTPAGSNTVEYLVVAGGGGGGRNNAGGGGGAGGFRFASPSIAPLTYPAKPLAGPANIPVTVQGYPITVGAGGTFGVNTPTGGNGTPGDNSVFSSITSTGGGGGGGEPSPTSGTNSPVTCTGVGTPTQAGFASGLPGGSGGGARGTQSYPGSPGPANNYVNPGGVPLVQNGNVPSASPSQGNPGGGGFDAVTTNSNGGGGGGAMAAGNSARGPGNGTDTGGPGGAGGGVPTAFGSNGQPCGSFRYYAGGGGGGQDSTPGSNPTGGVGGGGNGSANPGSATAGTVNTGGGGGNTSGGGCSAAGGSGIVVIRYKFQN